MLPPELQSAPPRDPNTAGALLAKNRLDPRSALVGFVLVPLGFILFAWIKYGIGSPSDLILATSIGLGIDAFIGLFVVVLSVQKNRAIRLFRSGVATTGIVRPAQAPADNYGSFQVEYRDDAGRAHTGLFSTLASQSGTTPSVGDTIPVLYLPANPRVCAFYTPGIGIVPGRAQG